ncbi:hypothetical protein HD806DRAFT_533270 [Xylariaceae sp. AK1471]|nr:hypothetical protein HD806DRAFT_533270 [Xylariaceae sp. AK1471]
MRDKIFTEEYKAYVDDYHQIFHKLNARLLVKYSLIGLCPPYDGFFSPIEVVNHAQAPKCAIAHFHDAFKATTGGQYRMWKVAAHHGNELKECIFIRASVVPAYMANLETSINEKLNRAYRLVEHPARKTTKPGKKVPNKAFAPPDRDKM